MTNSISLQSNKRYEIIAENNFVVSSSNFPVMLLEDRKKKNLNFHLESNDYFGTLATILGMAQEIIKQKIEELEKVNKAQSRLLNGLKDDLMYLQENYKIVRRK